MVLTETESECRLLPDPLPKCLGSMLRASSESRSPVWIAGTHLLGPSSYLTGSVLAASRSEEPEPGIVQVFGKIKI